MFLRAMEFLTNILIMIAVVLGITVGSWSIYIIFEKLIMEVAN